MHSLCGPKFWAVQGLRSKIGGPKFWAVQGLASGFALDLEREFIRPVTVLHSVDVVPLVSSAVMCVPSSWPEEAKLPSAETLVRAPCSQAGNYLPAMVGRAARALLGLWVRA